MPRFSYTFDGKALYKVRQQAICVLYETHFPQNFPKILTGFSESAFCEFDITTVWLVVSCSKFE